MIKLTEIQFKAIQADKRHDVSSSINCQLAGLFYRDDMEDLVFKEDVADDFVEYIKEKWDCSGWGDSDLVEWIRDIQRDKIDIFASSSLVSLERFIAEKFESQKEFAEKQNIKPPQVTQWIEKDFIVADGVLYSKRRDLNL